jgi:hypothetical protein
MWKLYCCIRAPLPLAHHEHCSLLLCCGVLASCQLLQDWIQKLIISWFCTGYSRMSGRFWVQFPHLRACTPFGVWCWHYSAGLEVKRRAYIWIALSKVLSTAQYWKAGILLFRWHIRVLAQVAVLNAYSMLNTISGERKKHQKVPHGFALRNATKHVLML